MTKQLLQTTILNIVENHETAIEVLFAFRDGDNFTIVKPALELKMLEAALKRGFINEVKDKLIETGANAYDFESIDNAEASDVRRVFYASRSAIPIASDLYNKFTNSEEIVDYDPDEHVFTSIWGIIVKIANADQQLFLFKKSYPINVLKKERVHTLFFRRGALELLDHEVLKLSNSFDFMYLDSSLIIINQKEFEKHFDYVRAVTNRAIVGLDIITASGLFTDTVKLFDLLDKGQQVKRMLNIKANNPVFAKRPKQIVDFAAGYNLTISLTEDGNHMDLKNKKEAISFLKLLNDDFLISELSGNKYNSKGKAKI